MRRTKSRVRKKAREVHLERRVRVTFFLPAELSEQKQAIYDIDAYLRGQHDHPVLPITGYTRSTIYGGSPIFKGHWWSQMNGGDKILTIEGVVLFIIDFRAIAEEWKLDQELSRLKAKILAYYTKHHCTQEEIWIVKEDIHRYA